MCSGVRASFDVPVTSDTTDNAKAIASILLTNLVSHAACHSRLSLPQHIRHHCLFAAVLNRACFHTPMRSLAAVAAAAAAHQPATSSLASEVARFLETCTHTILSERGLYPSGLFEPRRAYGLPVAASRHPLLSSYVSGLAESLRAWLVQGAMQRIVLAVLIPPRTEANPQATPKVVERFVFELCLMAPEPASAAANAGASGAASAAAAAAAAAAVFAPLPAATLAELHSAFALVLLRLASCDGHFTAKRPPDCTWTVLLYTSQPTPPPPTPAPNASPLARNPDTPALKWQQVPLASAAGGHTSASADVGAPFLDWPIGRCRIMSLRSIRLPLLHMEVYAEAGEV